MAHPFTTPLDKCWIQIVLKAWTDETFKQQLLADPAAVMKANGIPVPKGITITAVENTDKAVFVTLPAKPHGLTKDDVKKVSFGIIDDIGNVLKLPTVPAPILGAFGI